MNFTSFLKLVDEKKQANPIWFGLDSDKVADDKEVSTAQKVLNAEFPIEYIQFIKQYGGGYFALSVVYSLDESSDLNLVKTNKKELKEIDGYILFSENGSGDFYGFKTVKNRCLAEVFFFDHASGQWTKTKYDNLFSFLSEIALSN